MEASEEQTLILKGKRTKRQRPQSPIPFSMIPLIEDSTSINVIEEEDGVTNKINGVTISVSSASSSSNNNVTSTEKEDQDIAHCLILLAQGHSLSNHNNNQQQQQQQIITRFNESDHNNNGFRFSSRRFLETSSSNGGGGGKAGYYVYQCKTCDRTFPSFQALGGHRASHKKPKALNSETLKKTSIYNDTVSLHLNNNVATTSNDHRGFVTYGTKMSNKVHECGICGAEFTSGQALGGHMRRHRGAVVAAATAAAAAAATATTANTALSLSFDQSDGQDYPAKKSKSTMVSLDLDLNLPAPEDENRVNGLGFASKQEHETEHERPQQQQREEQKSLVLSAPTLVDCHY